jgi:MFS family permease
MPVFIIMRCLQAFGSSAVVAVGAGSLADMFEVHERGQKVGHRRAHAHPTCCVVFWAAGGAETT